MTTESDFWHEHVKALRSFGRVMRLENILDKGTSDVIYNLRWLHEPSRMGWVELKRLPKWPVLPGTNVWLPHYTYEQAFFLEQWGKSGAGAFLLAHIANEFVLVRWDHAVTVQCGVTKSVLLALACVHDYKRFPVAKVLRCLTAT